MAHMYPNVFPEDSKSSGERKVFEFFKSNAPSNWYILHSFRLPAHKKVVFGEADFVVIAPNIGVYILEIKSGGVGFDGTYWLFRNREGKVEKKHRGPFQQAREAMFEIEKIITDELGNSYNSVNIEYGYGVIFTDDDIFPLQSIVEDERWRLYKNVVSPDYCSFIKSLHTNFEKELNMLRKRIPTPLTDSDASKIASRLRPIVDCVVPFRKFIEDTERDILSFTEEQYSCLDDIEINDHMVVTGGAGTGKTLLAVEEAKRAAEGGLSVGLFCYNKYLADYIKSSLTDYDISVYSVHYYMTKICGNSIQDEKKDDKFFACLLPALATEVTSKDDKKFDLLIVDEFQDICNTAYLDFFDAVLKGGLMDGKFTFFGDFARQAIYDNSASLSTLSNYAFFARKCLTINCRNTRNIGSELINVTGYDGKIYKLMIDGEPVDYYVWNDTKEQIEKLNTRIKELKSKGFGGYSIVILSPKKRENSIINEYDPNGYLIGNYGDDNSLYYAMFSTIQAFKGLESTIVILVDIDNYDNSQLMYIGLSRARSKMIVLESAAAQKQRKKIMAKR